MADASAQEYGLCLTKGQVKALSPCGDRFHAVSAALGAWDGPVCADAAKKAGVTLDDLVWVASAIARRNKDVERRLRLWMADCAARVLHIANDPRSTAAVIAARQFARGEIDAAARAAAGVAAWTAAWTAAGAAAGDAAGAAAGAAAWDAAWDAAGAAAGDAAGAAAGDAAGVAEEQWQFDRLVLWLSADEPTDWPIPASLTEQAA